MDGLNSLKNDLWTNKKNETKNESSYENNESECLLD